LFDEPGAPGPPASIPLQSRDEFRSLQTSDYLGLGGGIGLIDKYIPGGHLSSLAPQAQIQSSLSHPGGQPLAKAQAAYPEPAL